MSNIWNMYLKVIIEEIWCSQNSNFPSLIAKISLLVRYFWELQITQISLCNFSITLILRGIMAFYSQRLYSFCWIKNQNLVKAKRNGKWKIPHTLLEREILCFSSYNQNGARKREKDAFFIMLILSKGNFSNICFVTMYGVLYWIKIQNIYTFTKDNI